MTKELCQQEMTATRIPSGRSRVSQGSTTKGSSEVWKERELSPRYSRPFEILERIGVLAYRLALPPNLASVHVVFHVSML